MVDRGRQDRAKYLGQDDLSVELAHAQADGCTGLVLPAIDGHESRAVDLGHIGGRDQTQGQDRGLNGFQAKAKGHLEAVVEPEQKDVQRQRAEKADIDVGRCLDDGILGVSKQRQDQAKGHGQKHG